MLNKSPLTFEKIEAALDAGKLQMMRPWGDWVSVRRRSRTSSETEGRRIHVWMEAQVEATISTHGAVFGFSDVRIAA